MRLWIETCDTPMNELSGKGLFCRRLAGVLRKMGIHVTADRKEKTDFALCLIRLTTVNADKKILRLDGVWHDTGKDWCRKNFPMRESLYKADGVIYQSEFARNMADRYLGEASCPTTVIPNGGDPDIYAKTKWERDYAHLFLAFSKWRPHKRLREIIRAFLAAQIPDSKL